MFISPAFAEAAAATPPEGPSMLMSALPLIIIFVLFYVLVLRPQSKRIREHADLLQALKAGDKVVTGGGLYATVVKIEGGDITVEIAPGVQVKAQKHTITALQELQAANDTAKK